MVKRVELGGGTRSGGRMDRQRAVRKDVCCTLSVDTKQLTNTGSYLNKPKKYKGEHTLQQDISDQEDPYDWTQSNHPLEDIS